MNRNFLTGFASASLLVASVIHAQATTGPSPVISRIQAIGIDSSRTEQLSHALFDSLGPRLTGTPDLKRANDWLVSTYKSWGIEARNEKIGTWRGWRRGYSHIDLITPRVRSLEGTMLGYSPGTGKKDLTATTIILPRFADSTEFVKWLPNAKGKFVLVSAPLPTCRPREDWAANATPASNEKMDSLRARVAREWTSRNIRGTGYNLAVGTGDLGMRMEQAGIAGIITSRSKDAWGTIEVFETYNVRAPAIALSCEDYGLVFRLTESGAKPQIRMNLDAELLGEQPIYNTVAMIRGSEKPDEYVVLSAHFDSWDGSSGATDNGTGTITMLEAMRILKQVYPKPRRTIVVGHWAGEEEGEVGSRAFTEDHPEVLKGLQALFNQDNGTGRIVRIGGAGLPNAAEHMNAWIAALPPQMQLENLYRGPGLPAGGGSDDFAFACYGLPAFGLGALNWDYNNYTWHTNRDTYDKVVFDDLKSNATLTAMLAYLASEDPTFITRERVDLAALAASQPPGGAQRRRGGFPTTWPACTKAARQTEPRLR
jgi:carboxypeptidase Q